MSVDSESGFPQNTGESSQHKSGHSPISLNEAESESENIKEAFQFENIPKMGSYRKGSVNGSDPHGITLSWHDLNAYIPGKKSGWLESSQGKRPFKRVLNNVSGIVYPGSLMAVMGASGAGKTTLMNILAYRAQGNMAIDGEIRANGIPLGNFMRHISGYVYQDDLFIGSLTVSEHLNFMARMKLDRRLKKWERERRIEELLIELGLKKCEHTRIGIPGQISGISGGERKRLSFASEVLTDPPLLFCDEPTTGLDSFSAQRLVGIMKALASKGKTIICTIHQPSSEIFSMFDQLCLLAEGRTAYLGTSGGALSFLKTLNFVCPPQYNPADFYIRTLAVTPGRREVSKRNIKFICDSFLLSEQNNLLEDNVQKELNSSDFLLNSFSHTRGSSTSTDSMRGQDVFGNTVRRPFFWTQAFWLTARAFKDSYRNPNVHIARSIQKIVLGLIIGLCYFGIVLNQRGIQDVQGAIFIFITENTFPSMYSVLHVFPQELPLFLRENKNGLYRVDAYYISKVIALLPGYIIDPIIFATIAYLLVGLRPTIEAYLLTLVVVILTANTAASCGMFFSAAFDSVSVAITCLVPFDYILMITGGIFINIATLPVYASWTKFLSWFMYANEAMSVVMWKGITNITCDATEGAPCITNGEDVLNDRSFYHHWSVDFIGLAVLYLLFHTGAYFALLLKSKRK